MSDKGESKSAEEVFADFAEYFKANRHVMNGLPKCINLMQRAGLGKFGFGMVLDWMRFHRDYRHLRVTIRQKQADFVIPNAFHSLYLHALCIWMPEHERLFHIRPSKGMDYRPQLRRLLIDTGFIREMPEAEAMRILKPHQPTLELHPQPGINLASGEIH